MLRLASWNTAYPTPVTVVPPAEEGDAPEVEVRFDLRLLPTPEYLKIAAQGNHLLVRAIVAGWEESALLDPEGRPMAFSPTNLATVSNVHWLAKAIVAAYWERFSPSKNA